VLALPEAGKRLFFHPGSTIGNLEPQEAKAFLRNRRRDRAHGWLRDRAGFEQARMWTDDARQFGVFVLQGSQQR
jgi:uncharacterized SAM-dependent methyltransferase